MNPSLFRQLHKHEELDRSPTCKVESLTLESEEAEQLIAEMVSRTLGKSKTQDQLEFPRGENVEGVVQFHPKIIRRDFQTETISCFGWDTHTDEGCFFYQVRFLADREEGIPVTFEIIGSFNHSNPGMVPVLF